MQFTHARCDLTNISQISLFNSHAPRIISKYDIGSLTQSVFRKFVNARSWKIPEKYRSFILSHHYEPCVEDHFLSITSYSKSEKKNISICSLLSHTSGGGGGGGTMPARRRLPATSQQRPIHSYMNKPLSLPVQPSVTTTQHCQQSSSGVKQSASLNEVLTPKI